MPTERRDKPDNAAAAPRKRALVSCDRCKLRRARCIREGPDEPCADCKVSGVQCESKLPRKQRVYGSVETLSLRYRALESLVKGLFPQEKTQHINVLFKIAAARNIEMPAADDYTPADIFSNGENQPPPPTPQHEQQPRPSLCSKEVQQKNPPAHIKEAVHYVDTRPNSSSSRDIHIDPFSDSQLSTRYIEEWIPPRHSVPHYFGPSSSFRLATTIRTLVARYKAIPGVSLPQFSATLSSQSYPGSRPRPSIHHSSRNPSVEEYLCIPRDLPDQDRVGRKRSRAQMEESSNQWEHREGSPNPDIIADLLPSRSLADALVAAYFDHIHVHLPLFHRNTFQFRLEATYSRKTERLKDCADIGWLVALALVFSFGCQQLQEHDPEQSHKLRLKYLGFAKGYLRHLLMDTCLVNVQALVLLNMHHHTVGQKSSSWLLIGLAARMAITMGMHRDGPNLEVDAIERNTRRQVFWSIYTFEKIICSIMGRPTVIDDRELSMQVPDTPMLEQKTIAAAFMATKFKLIRMSYSIRQRAYFDRVSAEERSPSLGVAELLLHECDTFFASIPTPLTLDFGPVPHDQRARVLLLHFYYFYTRCIISRDFLIQKVQRNICYLESRPPPPAEDWQRTLLVSEDCVESAHQSLNCIMAGAHLDMIGYSWLDLFFVFYSILIVCADFLARPKHQLDSAKDAERKDTVRAVLRYVKSMNKKAPTYKVLNEIAVQFAGITGVASEDFDMAQQTPSSADPQHLPLAVAGAEVATDHHAEISDVQEDWFANATTDLGADFWDLNQATMSMPELATGNLHQTGGQPYVYFETHPLLGEVDDWTARTLRGMHTI
ncbi:hypothetical protein J1614_007636 [Plenodomus biglobosus]|nr:hypothetical protein J1614_007636 [Plenodomus biglobosus]